MSLFIHDKNNLMLIELHKQVKARIAITSTENEDSKSLLDGCIPLNLYDLSDNSLVASYDSKTESFDLNVLLKYTNKQIISIAVDEENPESVTWVFFKLVESDSINNELETPMVILEYGPLKCNPEDVEFIDSILPNYRNIIIQQMIDSKNSTVKS